MQFVLTGFAQVSGFRVFTFQGIPADQKRAEQKRAVFTVRANLSLIRTYQILVQELPLLCQALLEKTVEFTADRSLTYSEDDMRRHSDIRTADKEAVLRKKSLRKIPPRPRPADAFVPSFVSR